MPISGLKNYSKVFLVLLFLAILFLQVISQKSNAQSNTSVETRLSELESREQIRRVMKQYGRFLDLKDFDSFAGLFAESESAYISGGVTTHGAKAIGQLLDNIFSANPSGLKEPAFHVFFNETIDFNSPTEATAFSQSAYVVPNESNAPEMVFFASYQDVFIIESGVWKFKQRIVLGDIPSRNNQ